MSSEHLYTKEEFFAYGDRLHYNTIIDITINIFAAYIVYKYSTPAMKTYKYYILLTIFCAFFMDFHITFIFGPFMMLPAPIMCGAGFICRNFDYFWGEYIQYGIMNITVSCVGCSIVAGLFYQLFSLNGNIEFFHSIKGVIIIVLIMIFYPFPSYAILLSAFDYDRSIAYVKNNYNNSYELFISTPSCFALILDFKGKLHYACLALQVAIVFIVASIVALKIHRKLAKMKNILSSTTLKARRQLLTALCFQMAIPSILIAFPIVSMLIGIVADVKEINVLSSIAMPIISLHSFANALSLMYIITPYRKAIANIIRTLFRLKEKPIRNVTENSTKSYNIARVRNSRNVM